MTSRWLRLVRIHTSSLTQAVVLLGLVIDGKWEWLRVVLFALFAVVYHAAGFIYNDICDYEHDRCDEAKKHFPLVSGEISLRLARSLYTVLGLITLIFGTWLSKGRIFSILFLIAAMGFGHLYNKRCKKDLASPAYITAAFISLPLLSYFSHSGRLSLLMFLVVSYLIFLMLYQIAVEGYMKDIGSDKNNLLMRMGTAYSDKGVITVNARTKLFAWSLRLPAFILFVVIWHLSDTDPIGLAIGIFLIIGMIYAGNRLLASGSFDNRKRVRLCAIIEVLTYTLLITSLLGILGWTGFAFFILYPYGWFLLLNRLTWKTLITPRV